MLETSENSIFIYDCMRARKEEFSRLTIVNTDTINIPERAKAEL